MPAIANVPGGPWAAGTTPVYTATLVDGSGNPISGVTLAALTLTIADTLTGTIINGVSQINILNTGRGTIDAAGLLTISLEPGDTSMSETTGPQVQRSLIIDWTYNAGAAVGRHQANFMLVALAGA